MSSAFVENKLLVKDMELEVATKRSHLYYDLELSIYNLSRYQLDRNANGRRTKVLV